jgi:hypothetical protein
VGTSPFVSAPLLAHALAIHCLAVTKKEKLQGLVTKSLLALIISQDAASRKAGVVAFPLASTDDVSRLKEQFRPVRYPRFAPDVFHTAGQGSWNNLRQAVQLQARTRTVAQVWERLAGYPLFEPFMAASRAERVVSDVELIVAGGGVASAWNDQYWSGDLDFFFVSPSMDVGAASRFVTRLVQCACISWEAGFVLTKNEYCITFYAREADDSAKHQLILRLYPSAEAVIGGFDLGSCAVMLHDYGTRLSFTHLGAWCDALSINIVDCSRRSPSYEQRLVKYATRGYQIVFPGLVESTEDTIALHNLTLLRAKPFDPRHQIAPFYVSSVEGPTSDYYNDEMAYYPNTYITHQNWYNAVTGKPEHIVAWTDYNFQGVGFFLENPLDHCIVHTKDIEYQVQERQYDGKTIVARLRHRFGQRAKDYMLAELEGDSARSKHITEEVVESVRSIFEARTRKLGGPLNWITANPGGQEWTSSVSPIFEDPRRFYLSHYQRFATGITDQCWFALSLLRKFDASAAQLPVEVWVKIGRMVVASTYLLLFESPRHVHQCTYCDFLYRKGMARCRSSLFSYFRFLSSSCFAFSCFAFFLPLFPHVSSYAPSIHVFFSFLSLTHFHSHAATAVCTTARLATLARTGRSAIEPCATKQNEKKKKKK